MNSPHSFRDSIRVSFDNATSSDVAAAIDPEGDLHVVWVDYRSGNGDIYYVKLDSEGNKLVNDAKITNDTWASRNPTVAVDDRYHIYVVWQDDRTGNWELYFARLLYSPYNITFERNDVRVSDADPADSIQPHIAVDNAGNIVMVWADARHMSGNQNYEIYYKKLDPDGNAITSDRRITNDPGISIRPRLAISSDNAVHLTWYDFRDSADGRVINHGIFFRVLDQNGTPLIPDTRITFASESSTPALALDGDGISYIVFDDDRYADFDIFFTKIASDGMTLIDDIRISPQDTGSSLRPDIALDPRGCLVVVWQDNASGQWVIKYNRMNNNGTIIEQDITISSPELSNSTSPKVLMGADNSTLLLWIGEIDDNTEVYFTRADLPDLYLRASDISLSDQMPIEGFEVLVSATVHNGGLSEAKDVVVRLVIDGESRDSATIPSIPSQDARTVSMKFYPVRGENVSRIVVDPDDLIFESDETNNWAEVSFVTTFFDFAVQPNVSKLIIAPGAVENLSYAVTNLGNMANTIEINFSHEFPDDWHLLIDGIDSTSFTITVPPDDTTHLPISLSLPDGAPAGIMMLNASSRSLNDPSKRADTSLPVEVSWRGLIGIALPAPKELVPGSSHLFEFRVTNLGNNPESFLASFHEDNGWETSVAGGLELNLDPGENITVHCSVRVPEFTPPMVTSTLTIQVDSLNLTDNTQSGGVTSTVVTLRRIETELTSQNVTQDATHATSGSFHVMIYNLGNIPEQVNVSLDTGQPEWLSIEQSLLLLQPGESRLLRINVSAPPTALAGSYEFSMRARSVQPPSVESVLTISFEIEAFQELYVTVLPSSVEGHRGSMHNVTVCVYNYGNALDMADMFIDIGAFNRTYAFVNNTLYNLEFEDIPSIQIESNEMLELLLSIEIPKGIELGSYTIWIAVSSGMNPLIGSDAVLSIEVEHKRSFFDFIMSPVGLVIVGVGATAAALIVLSLLRVFPFRRPSGRRKPPARKPPQPATAAGRRPPSAATRATRGPAGRVGPMTRK